MEGYFSRSELLLGKEGMQRLNSARVAVFGVGGVGGYIVEALARSGVGEIDVIDNDVISASNINRQIIALTDNIGEYKVDVIEARARKINPNVKVNCRRMFFMPDTAEKIDFAVYDYVADAIDTVTGKIEIIMRAKKAGVPVISSMGTGNKLDPTRFEVADIYSTSVCPLARVMRRELRARGVDALKVVYSREESVKTDRGEKPVTASVAFVPAVAGLIMAGEIIKDISGGKAR